MIRSATSFDASAIARIHVEARNAVYPAFAPPAVAVPRTEDQRRVEWYGRLARPEPGQIVLVTIVRGAVRAFGHAGDQRDAKLKALGHGGEVRSLYALERGVGLGTRVLDALLTALANAGHGSAALWVLEKNPALEFYKSRGGTPIRRRISPAHGLAEVALAFDLSRRREGG